MEGDKRKGLLYFEGLVGPGCLAGSSDCVFKELSMRSTLFYKTNLKRKDGNSNKANQSSRVKTMQKAWDVNKTNNTEQTISAIPTPHPSPFKVWLNRVRFVFLFVTFHTLCMVLDFNP